MKLFFLFPPFFKGGGEGDAEVGVLEIGEVSSNSELDAVKI